MASQLTNMSNGVRQYGLTVLAGLVGVIIIWNIASAGYRKLTAPKATPTPAANVALGKLDPLQFKEKPPTSQGLQINLETIDGKVPPLATPSAIVYEIEKKAAGLDYAEKALAAAANAGFESPQVQEDGESAFIFIDPNDQNRRMRYDFTYSNLEYKYENLNSYVSLEVGSAPTLQTASTNAKAFISAVNRDASRKLGIERDQVTPNETFYYLEPATNDLKEVATHTQANLTVLNYPIPKVANFPIIGPSATESLVRFVYTGITSSSQARSQTRLLEATIISWPIIETPAAGKKLPSYPLKSQTTAWNELLAGKAAVLNEVNPGESFNVRRIYMGYYAPDIQAKYLQPVWVFEGDKVEDSKFLFRAIVPAVAEPYSESIQ